MPSIRKRIGYLPSLDIQEIITAISKKEKLSQSKVVGILVEEALIHRGLYTLQDTNYLIESCVYKDKNYIHNSSFNSNNHDELISDKGITYKTKINRHKSNNFTY